MFGSRRLAPRPRSRCRACQRPAATALSDLRGRLRGTRRPRPRLGDLAGLLTAQRSPIPITARPGSPETSPFGLLRPSRQHCFALPCRPRSPWPRERASRTCPLGPPVPPVVDLIHLLVVTLGDQAEIEPGLPEAGLQRFGRRLLRHPLGGGGTEPIIRGHQPPALPPPPRSVDNAWPRARHAKEYGGGPGPAPPAGRWRLAHSAQRPAPFPAKGRQPWDRTGPGRVPPGAPAWTRHRAP